MIESSISRRYARALLGIAKDENKLDDYLMWLESFASACQSNSQLAATLSNRFVDLSARLRVVTLLAEKIGSSVHFKNFLKILVEKDRISLIERIASTFKTYVFEELGQVEADVISARELDSRIYEEIASLFQNKIGKKVVTRAVIKKDVIGGVAVKIDGKIFDGTIKGELDRLGGLMRKSSI